VSAPDAAFVFKGRDRWLLSSYVWGNAFGGLVAAIYAYQTLELGGSGGRLLSVWAVPAIVGVLYWMFAGSRRLRTARYLAAGRATVSDETVIDALREVRALPDWLRRLTQVSWPSSAFVAALFAHFGAGAGSDVALRLFLGTAVFGPLSGELVYLVAMRRSRLFVEVVSALVPARKVLAALAGEKSRRVRARLVMLTITLVVIPAALMVDVTRTRSQRAQAAVVAAPHDQQQDVARREMRAAMVGSLGLGLALVAFALTAAYLAGASLAGPLKHIADESNRISRGDLRDVRIVAAEDELWAVTSSFTLLQAQLQEVVGQLQRAGISIGSTTEQLMATSSKYESGAADQASSLNETSATTEELAQSARQISHNAASVSDLAVKTFEAARAGQDSAQAFVSAVDRMKHDNQSIAEAVTRLQKRVQQIGRIVEFITTVADRSDLLALSAELEGTKAGEVGRGFTLVAAEMRRLAENVIESTNEIEELIGEIREATQSTVTATARGMEHTQSGTALAGAVADSLSKVVELAQHTSDSVRAISLATQQQQSSTDQLAEAMADILGITQQSLAATKQVTSANHELITLSGDLKTVVDRFQTGLK
jgi:methyl-accepting chemotaxis protein